MRFYQSSYTGGAHGNQWDTHVTFDLTTGEVVTLDDLFKKGWEAPLTALAAATIRRDSGLQEDEPLTEGPLFEDSLVLNSNWFLSPEGIGFSFVPYEIGPYAAGFIQPVMPLEVLGDLLKGNSLLDRAVSR